MYCVLHEVHGLEARVKDNNDKDMALICLMNLESYATSVRLVTGHHKTVRTVDDMLRSQ
jgi:hypothetical protein